MNRILIRPIYAGYIESKEWDVSLRKGQHEGVISLETFERVQCAASSPVAIAIIR